MADVQDRKRRNLKNLLRPSTPTGLLTSISLLEQAVFVNTSFPAPSVLRGSVRLDVSKNVQLQDLCIRFTGLNRVHKFGRFYTKECVIDQKWSIRQLECRRGSAQNVTNLVEKESASWPVLHPGHYSHHFELTLNDPLPETFDVGGCTLRYHVQAIATVRGPPSICREQVSRPQEVVVVHCPHDDIYLHEVNQISLSRIWNRQIAYNVELADKGAAIGGKIPISMRIACSDITYLAVQIFLAQKIKFPGIPGRQTQLRKRLLLKSKCNDLSKGVFNDGSSLSLGREDGTIVIAGSVPLLDDSSAHLRLHPDVNFSKVKASHTILVLIDITIPNKQDKEKNSICRLTAETPFCVRSSQSQHYDLSVPPYAETHNRALNNRFDILQSLPPSFDSLSSQVFDPLTKEFDIPPQSRTISMCSLPSREEEAVSLTPLYPPPAYESVVGS